MGQTNHECFTVGPYDKQPAATSLSLLGRVSSVFSDEQGDACNKKSSDLLRCDLEKKQCDIPIQG